MEKNQKELTDVLVEMQHCKINEIDFDTKIKNAGAKGHRCHRRSQEQWEKMTPVQTGAGKPLNVASLIHMISETYTEVSNKYLMDRVSSLGKLMAMDKERPEFLHERLKLQESCDEAQRGILQLVLKNKKEFEMKTDARMKKIEGELKAILPAAPPEETERIKVTFQAGFSKEEESYY
ncbi:uncharacterized protein AKAME5_002238400 [Lates japonicus]|uniref:Uncharacterized protein n=1 Tax=Lates japonicus TaxID=270547 RepID=A0AAD3NFK9_LATJO|nr:uncharacterized protein AKAME5_002238400 [Lates japonicus]